MKGFHATLRMVAEQVYLIAACAGVGSAFLIAVMFCICRKFSLIGPRAERRKDSVKLELGPSPFSNSLTPPYKSSKKKKMPHQKRIDRLKQVSAEKRQSLDLGTFLQPAPQTGATPHLPGAAVAPPTSRSRQLSEGRDGRRHSTPVVTSSAWLSTPNLAQDLGPTSSPPQNNLFNQTYNEEEERDEVVSSDETSDVSVPSAPSLNFNISYRTQQHQLNINFTAVRYLAKKFNNSMLFIKVTLHDGDYKISKKESVKGKISARQCAINESITFSNVCPENVDALLFVVKLYATLPRRLRRTVVGEVRVQVGDVEMAEDGEYKPLSRPLLLPNCRAASSTASLQEHIKFEKLEPRLGKLLVSLQYQGASNRLKVFIRRAEHLAKLGHKVLPGSGDHYVAVRLMRGDEETDRKETKRASGENPNFNQPFLFDVPHHQVERYWLDLHVTLCGVHRVNFLGHVMIGPGLEGSGGEHWTQTMLPRGVDVARWHNIQHPTVAHPKSKRQKKTS